MISKGWTKKNIGRGSILAGAGLILGVIDYISAFLAIGDSDARPIPSWAPLLNWISIAMVVFAILGFWFVIPAFQKWHGTKKEWLAWVFLIIAIFIIYIIIYLWNTF